MNTELSFAGCSLLGRCDNSRHIHRHITLQSSRFYMRYMLFFFFLLFLSHCTSKPSPTGPAAKEGEGFDIHLVISKSLYRAGYTETDIEAIYHGARKWEEVLLDIPDWEVDLNNPKEFFPDGVYCHIPRAIEATFKDRTFYHLVEDISVPTKIDDISIHILRLDDAWVAKGIAAMGVPIRSRHSISAWEGPFSMTVSGCIAIRPGLKGEQLAMTIAHEIGHVLGFGTHGYQKHLIKGRRQQSPHYIGRQALQVYHRAGGKGDIPLEKGGSHWKGDLLKDTLMSLNSNKPLAISALDVAAMADMGYPVNFNNATPLRLLDVRGKIAASNSWCGICRETEWADCKAD